MLGEASGTGKVYGRTGRDLNYQDTAYKEVKCSFTDFTEEELRNCIEKAYTQQV